MRRICTWLHGVERQVQLVRLKACLSIHCIGGRNVTLPSGTWLRGVGSQVQLVRREAGLVKLHVLSRQRRVRQRAQAQLETPPVRRRHVDADLEHLALRHAKAPAATVSRACFGQRFWRTVRLQE